MFNANAQKLIFNYIANQYWSCIFISSLFSMCFAGSMTPSSPPQLGDTSWSSCSGCCSVFHLYCRSRRHRAPQYLIFRVTRGPFLEEFHQCVTYDFYTAKWQEQLYTTFTLIFMFIIPLGILLVTYISTFRTIAGLYFSIYLWLTSCRWKLYMNGEKMMMPSLNQWK